MPINRTSITNLVLALIAIFVLSSKASAGGILFVDDDAAPGGDGASWNTAYRFLQDAITTANGDGSGIVEIRIAQGIYKPDRSEASPNGSGDRHAWFTPANGLRLGGGFAGIGADDPDQRDVQKFETILSGDLLGNDGPNFLNNDENSLHIFFLKQDKGFHSELDGLTITSANANLGSVNGTGSGILNGMANLTILSCTFRNNFALDKGAGIHMSIGREFIDKGPNIIDCLFENNSTMPGGSGGAIYINKGRPLIIGCEFISNESHTGGAVSIIGNPSDDELFAGATFYDCLFQENSRSALKIRTASCEINDCIFYANSNAGTIASTRGSEVFITSCIFLENISLTPSGIGAAGAIFSGQSGYDPDILVLSQCAFISNLAGSYGGALFLTNTFATIDECVFIGNTSGEQGGAIVNYAETNVKNSLFTSNTSARGGAILNCCNGGVITITNSTIANNSASESGGGINNGFNEFSQGEAIIHNCVLWGNTDAGKDMESAQIFNNPVATWTIDYSCVQGLTGNLGGIGNIGDNPLFIEPLTDDFRLSSGSPCIDAGNNWAVPRDADDYDQDGILCELFPVDLDGNPRFNADEADFDPGCGTPVVVDMGAYEYQFDPVDQITFADLNGDNLVSTADLLILLASWGSCDGCCIADLDIDNSVGTSDLLELLANWGPCK